MSLYGGGSSCSPPSASSPRDRGGLDLRAQPRQQRTRAERIGLELARALATAVDAKLRTSISVP